MDNSGETKPLIQQGWLRVLLFISCYFFISLIISIPAILWLTSVKPDDLQNDILQVLSNLATGDHLWLIALLEFVISLLCVFIVRKFVDRKTFASLGFIRISYLDDVIAAFFIAPAIIGISSLILHFAGHLSWDDIVFSSNSFFIETGILIFIAVGEELVFRGYILNNLMQSFNKWVALLISSLLFALFHLASPGIETISFANLLLAGVLFGINYIYTKNLWTALAIHFSWNFFEGPLSGFKVTGINFTSVLQPEMKGGALITGGEFGLEGSFVLTGIMLIAVLSLYFVYEKKFAMLNKQNN